MNRTEHPAKTPSCTTGRSALLGVFLRGQGSGAHLARPIAACLAATATLIAVLAVAASPALAGFVYPKLGEISGPKPGQLFGYLSDESVAVDDADGHVLIADSSNDTVYDYSSLTDTSPEAWTGSNTPLGYFSERTEGDTVEPALSVAADNGTGDVYVAGNIAGTERWVIDKFEASGKLITSFGDSSPAPNGQLAGLDTPAKSFDHPVYSSEPLGIAVDQATHDLYVLDSGHEVIDVFNEDGAYLSQITAAPADPVPPGKMYEAEGAFTSGIAVSSLSGDVFVSEGYGSEGRLPYIAEFNSLGSVIGTFTGADAPNSFKGKISVAVNDLSEDFYVASATSEAVDEFGPGGLGSEAYLGRITGLFERTERVGAGLAVDQASGDLYVAESWHPPGAHEYEWPYPLGAVVKVFGGTQVMLPDVTTGKAAEAKARSAKLNGEVRPEGVSLTKCKFEYIEAAKYQPSATNPYAGGGTAECAPSYDEIPANSEYHPVHADITGLSVGTTYDYRLVAANANGAELGENASLETIPPPSIEEASSSKESISSATLEASIDDHGLPASYRFEYGKSTAYGTSAPAPEGSIGEGTSPVAVSEAISGLEANVTYHWRVVASSEAGTTTSPDHTFLYDTEGEGLPDKRAYEMVTPPAKNGALFDTLLGGSVVPTASRGGDGIVLQAVQCFGDSQSCPGDHDANEGTGFLSSRTAAGWVTSGLAAPAALGESAVLKVNVETGAALLVVASAGGGEDFYARHADGTYSEIGPIAPPSQPQAEFQGSFALASADISHVVWQTSEDEWPFDETKAGDVNLFEYAEAGESQPELVAVSGGHGSTSLISRCGAELGGAERYVDEADSQSALSASGEVVYFTALGGAGCWGSDENEDTKVPVNEIYARIGGSETVDVSEPSAGEDPACTGACLDNIGPGHEAQFRSALFQGASEDGSHVIFTSEQQLTNDAVQGEENLYEATLARNATTGRMELQSLVDVSHTLSNGEEVGLQGVVALSGDGSHVYFVAHGVLTSEERAGCKASFEAAGVAEEGRCGAHSGAENLYVASEGKTAFVAMLSPEREAPGRLEEPDSQQWHEEFNRRRANVSPDGRFLVFTSVEALTPDQPGRAGTAGERQVFRYDAATGGLQRVSIGERGFNDDGNTTNLNAFASTVPVYVASVTRAGSVDGDPTMSDDGTRVFFASPVALTPHALNEVPIYKEIWQEREYSRYAENVYEWEQEGAGSCPAGQSSGCVYLISDGRDTALKGNASDVELLGADASGDNVFFSTSDQLVPADTDTQVDVYDARVCEPENGNPCIQPAPAAPPPCQGEQCHGTPAASPLLPNVPSATFDGVGNVVPSPAASVKKKKLTRAQQLASALKTCRRDRSKRKRAMCDRRAQRKWGSAKRSTVSGKRGK